MDQKLFPVELLESSIEDRICYFYNYTVSHPVFEKAYEGLFDRINSNTGNSIILVFGPTGAGKSKLIEKVNERIVKENLNLLQENKGLLPTLTVEAVPPDSGSFDWKDFYYRALVEANEPLIDFKITRNNETMGKKIKDDGRTALRRSLENVLIYRKPFAFIIDEAHHISMTIKGRNLINQVNILKSLANKTKVPIVLFGTYDLITYRDLNDQTIRRGKDIHLQRYRAQYEKELESFINVLLAFQKHLPLENEPNLIEHWDYFYSRTIGCVGILKDWLYVTYSINLKNNPSLKTLTIDDFREHALPLDKCLKLLEKTKLGEKKYYKSESEQELYMKLGLIAEDSIEEVQESEDTEKSKKNRKGKNRRPGQRKAKRDSVGLDEMEEAQ